MRKYDYENMFGTTRELQGLEKTSPFAVRENEFWEKKPTSHPRYIELDQVQGEIIKLCNRYLILTERMLDQCLHILDYPYPRTWLHPQLLSLAESGYLDQMVIKGKNAAPINAFAVGCKGSGWLKSNHIRPRLHSYIEDCDTIRLKKILAANQFMTEKKYSCEKCLTGEMVIEHHKRTSSKLFRGYGSVRDNGKQIYVEVVRNTEKYYDNLLEKLNRMDNTLEVNRKLSGQMTETEVVVITENEAMMREIKERLEKYKKYRNFSIFVTYDRWLLGEGNDNLEKVVQRSFIERIFHVA